MKKLFVVAILLLLWLPLTIGEKSPYEGVQKLKKTLEVPKAFYDVHLFNPATYLEMFKNDDLINLKDAMGRAKEPEKLKRLFVSANNACIKKYGQSYMIDRNCDLYKMLEITFPWLKGVEGEPANGKPNQSLKLSKIAKILTGIAEK